MCNPIKQKPQPNNRTQALYEGGNRGKTGPRIIHSTLKTRYKTITAPHAYLE